MKTLHYARINDLSRLHDELLSAIPGLRPILNAQRQREAVMVVQGREDDIWLTVPDMADEVTIAAVVQSHNPLTPKPPTAAEIAQAQAISDAGDALVVEIDKAFTARGPNLTATEKAGIKDKAVNLIAKAQGR